MEYCVGMTLTVSKVSSGFSRSASSQLKLSDLCWSKAVILSSVKGLANLSVADLTGLSVDNLASFEAGTL